MDFKPATICNIPAYIIYNSSMKVSMGRGCKHINSCKTEEVSRIYLAWIWGKREFLEKKKNNYEANDRFVPMKKNHKSAWPKNTEKN